MSVTHHFDVAVVAVVEPSMPVAVSAACGWLWTEIDHVIVLEDR